jgi:hypothetical protein
VSRRPHQLQLQSTLVPTRRQRAVSAAVVDTRSLHRPGCCLQSCTVVESADARMDTGIERSPQFAAAPFFAQRTSNCCKLCLQTLSRQWTMQLLVDAQTECTGSLIRARLARRGYRFTLFSDAQGTSSVRIRVGQRGQGTRTRAARRGSVVAAANIPQSHRRSGAR